MSKLKIGPGVMLSRRAGKTDLMRQIHPAAMVSKEVAAASMTEVEEGVFVPTSSIRPGVIEYTGPARTPAGKGVPRGARWSQG